MHHCDIKKATGKKLDIVLCECALYQSSSSRVTSREKNSTESDGYKQHVERKVLIKNELNFITGDLIRKFLIKKLFSFFSSLPASSLSHHILKYLLVLLPHVKCFFLQLDLMDFSSFSTNLTIFGISHLKKMIRKIKIY